MRSQREREDDAEDREREKGATTTVGGEAGERRAGGAAAKQVFFRHHTDVVQFDQGTPLRRRASDGGGAGSGGRKSSLDDEDVLQAPIFTREALRKEADEEKETSSLHADLKAISSLPPATSPEFGAPRERDREDTSALVRKLSDGSTSGRKPSSSSFSASFLSPLSRSLSISMKKGKREGEEEEGKAKGEQGGDVTSSPRRPPSSPPLLIRGATAPSLSSLSDGLLDGNRDVDANFSHRSGSFVTLEGERRGTGGGGEGGSRCEDHRSHLTALHKKRRSTLRRLFASTPWGTLRGKSKQKKSKAEEEELASDLSFYSECGIVEAGGVIGLDRGGDAKLLDDSSLQETERRKQEPEDGEEKLSSSRYQKDRLPLSPRALMSGRMDGSFDRAGWERLSVDQEEKRRIRQEEEEEDDEDHVSVTSNNRKKNDKLHKEGSADQALRRPKREEGSPSRSGDLQARRHSAGSEGNGDLASLGHGGFLGRRRDSLAVRSTVFSPGKGFVKALRSSFSEHPPVSDSKGGGGCTYTATSPSHEKTSSVEGKASSSPLERGGRDADDAVDTSDLDKGERMVKL